MTFDVGTPTGIVLNGVEELGDITTTYINTYTNQQYINLAYNIINKTGQYKICLREWNYKDTAVKTWDSLKPHFCTDDKELKDVADETVADAVFQ